MLRDFPAEKMRVFVVWEPILVTDLAPPANRELERVSDGRAAQFWDRNATVSRAIRAPIVARGQDDKHQSYRSAFDRLWDTVAVYPAGAQWADHGPQPAFSGGPVVNVVSGLREALHQATKHPDLKPETRN